MSVLRRSPLWKLVSAVVAAVLASSMPLAPGLAQESNAVRIASTDPSAGLEGRTPVRLGVYDPHGAFSQVPGVAIEHIYIPWVDVDLASLEAADKYASDRGRQLLITVEPWSWSAAAQVAPDRLLSGILSGDYDQVIGGICSQADGLKSNVTLRWGHEMDLAGRDYPWSKWAPADYAAAYRHFVERCRPLAPRALYMWSPRGEQNMLDYYPGDSFVDSIGLSAFGLEAYDVSVFGRQRGLDEIIAPSLKLVANCKKPIILAEVGCGGNRKYIAECRDALDRLALQYPCLDAVVYFNEQERAAWPGSFGRPDWRMPQAMIDELSTSRLSGN